MMLRRCIHGAAVRSPKPVSPTHHDSMRQLLMGLEKTKITEADIDPSRINTHPNAMASTFTHRLLKDYCAQHQLKVSGTKPELIRRIRAYWGLSENDQAFRQVEIQFDPKHIELVQSHFDQIAVTSHCQVEKVPGQEGRIRIQGLAASVVKAQRALEKWIASVHRCTLNEVSPVMQRVLEEVAQHSHDVLVLPTDKSRSVVLASDTSMALLQDTKHFAMRSAQLQELMDQGNVVRVAPQASAPLDYDGLMDMYTHRHLQRGWLFRAPPPFIHSETSMNLTNLRAPIRLVLGNLVQVCPETDPAPAAGFLWFTPIPAPTLKLKQRLSALPKETQPAKFLISANGEFIARQTWDTKRQQFKDEAEDVTASPHALIQHVDDECAGSWDALALPRTRLELSDTDVDVNEFMQVDATVVSWRIHEHATLEYTTLKHPHATLPFCTFTGPTLALNIEKDVDGAMAALRRALSESKNE